MSSNKFFEQLNLKFPLIVAPMAGGPSSTELLIATAKAGALGSIGAAYSTGKSIEDFVFQVRTRTTNPIAINLFIPTSEPKVTETQISDALKATDKFRNELGLQSPVVQPPYEENFDDQFESILKIRPAVFSFVFGLLKSEYILAAKKENILLLGTATTLDEALSLQESGVDAITLQGIEAGGHRGMFDPNAKDPEISVLNLVSQCRPKINVPLIAAGGIMNSEHIRLAIGKGADAVQMGTAFLGCTEAGTPPPYKRAILASADRKTKTTRAFSGRLARGLENRFLLEMEKYPNAILPFQAQNKFTRDIRAASAKNDSSEFLSLWCGAGAGPIWSGPAAELIDSLFSSES